MRQSIVVHSEEIDSATAGRSLGERVAQAFDDQSPDVLIVFASSKHDYRVLLQSLDQACRPELMVGCSSAGEFISGTFGVSSACAVALRSSEMKFAAGIGREVGIDRKAAVQQMVAPFQGLSGQQFVFRSALVLTDALAGYAEELVESLTLATAGRYQLFGGGAGDDARFSRTHVFYGTEALTNAAVALEILSNKPLGVGVQHGWKPTGRPMRVTEAEGTRVVSINAAPAIEAFQQHALQNGQPFERENPLPFFLHNILGIDTGSGFKLRVPLAIGEDGSVSCAAEIPTGATVHVMSATGMSAAEAAAQATETALARLGNNPPEVALFFDCVATRLRMGGEFGMELHALQEALGAASYAGCNTYGQISRADGQFSGFHNCTAVICVFPK